MTSASGRSSSRGVVPAGTVVDVVVGAAGSAATVVVVSAGAVVVVVAASSGGSSCSTGRKRSSAVCPTISRARAWSFTPGSCTMIDCPWVLMSGSATPRASTRLRMISTDWLRTPSSTFRSGWSTT
jgi:hypothetical protein